MKKNVLTQALSAAAGAAASSVLERVGAEAMPRPEAEIFRLAKLYDETLARARAADVNTGHRLAACERQIDVLMRRVATLELTKSRRMLAAAKKKKAAR